MNPFEPPVVQWESLLPLLILIGGAVVGVFIEAFVPRQGRRGAQLGVSALALASSLVAVAWRFVVVTREGPQPLMGGTLREDLPGLAAQGVLLILALLGFFLVADRFRGEDSFAPTAAAVPGSEYEDQARRLGWQQTEVFPLLLFAVLGMAVFPIASDLLTLFVALEVLSLPLYLLVGMARRRRLLSQEASLKYFLLGAFASALFLMGLALLYGYGGTVTYAGLAQAVGMVPGMDGIAFTGVVLVVVGLLFKLGAAPFHQWTPDVYQGAPTPVTAFMAACTKVAAFAALLRFVYEVTPSLSWDIQPLLWAVAILTMLLGTVLAIVQTDLKRTLAYSSVAHAGFLLLGVIALNEQGISGTWVYLLSYGLATIGAFGLISMVRERDAEGNVLGEATHLSQWAGLGRTSPLLAGTYALFLLSFAGIPLTAGFVGKFAVFSAVFENGWQLVVVAVLASAAAAFFYVRIIVLMFFTEPAETSSTAVVLKGEGLTAVTVAVAALGTVAIGVFPDPLLHLAAEATKFLL